MHLTENPLSCGRLQQPRLCLSAADMEAIKTLDTKGARFAR